MTQVESGTLFRMLAAITAQPPGTKISTSTSDCATRRATPIASNVTRPRACPPTLVTSAPGHAASALLSGSSKHPPVTSQVPTISPPHAVSGTHSGVDLRRVRGPTYASIPASLALSPPPQPK